MFKITQGSYNIRLLARIKKLLGVGNVSVPAGDSGEYRVRDPKSLDLVIRPLFQEKPLLTSKQYDLELFFLALAVHMDPKLSKSEKNSQLSELRRKCDAPAGYASPA